jgi:hypothetical protein
MSTLVTDLTIQQGATFQKTVHWYGGGKVCKEVSAIETGCPTVLTVTGHGMPQGDTPVTLSARGAKELDTKNKRVIASYIDANTISVPINTLGKTYSRAYVAVHYYAPKNLTNYTARMQIREDIEDASPLISLTSVAGDIVIDTANAGITVTIAADDTEDLDFDEAVYDLELEDVNGVVTRLLEGSVFLSDEVTR